MVTESRSIPLAFSTNAFSRFSVFQAVQAIAEAGYEGVEILADTPHLYPDTTAAADVLKLADLLRQLDLRVSNVNANCLFGFFKDPPPEPFFEPSLISPVAHFRRARVELIGKTIEMASVLGAQNVSITSGKALPTVPPGLAWELLKENLKPVLDVATKHDMKIGIECEPMLFIEWADELAALIGDIGSPLLGANWDVGHSQVAAEPMEHVLRVLHGRIWNLHVEEIVGRKHYHLIPGTPGGTTPWAELHTCLIQANYNRFATVELYTYPENPLEAAQHSAAFLRRWFRTKTAAE